ASAQAEQVRQGGVSGRAQSPLVRNLFPHLGPIELGGPFGQGADVPDNSPTVAPDSSREFSPALRIEAKHVNPHPPNRPSARSTTGLAFSPSSANTVSRCSFRHAL